MRRKLVVANWKMHGNLASNQELLTAYIEKLSLITTVDVVVCVPYPYLPQVQAMLQNTSIAWGAQNLSKDAVGDYWPL
jgi:triosephosphate isomerase